MKLPSWVRGILGSWSSTPKESSPGSEGVLELVVLPEPPGPRSSQADLVSMLKPAVVRPVPPTSTPVRTYPSASSKPPPAQSTDPSPPSSRTLSPSDRAKLDTAYQMEKHRANPTSVDQTGRTVFRKFVPPVRPANFWSLPLAERMWYCRMEELAHFRREDEGQAGGRTSSPRPGLPGPRSE